MAFAAANVLTNLVIPAYDRLVEFQLREQPTFRSMVDRKPANVTNPGDTVTFTWYADLATAETPLVEDVTPASGTIGNPTRTTVTVNEYGSWVPKTIRLQTTAFTRPDSEIAELLARQQADTIDNLVRAKMDAGTNILDLTAQTTKNFSAGGVRQVRNKMRRNKVQPKAGPDYLAHIHPDVSFDLVSESGTNNNVWASPHTYGGDTGAVYSGELGRYSGVRFIENTRCKIITTDVPDTYFTYVFGRQALVEANVIEPHTVIGPQTDALRRHFPVGWYGFLGWNLFRPESLLVVKSQSSLVTT